MRANSLAVSVQNSKTGKDHLSAASLSFNPAFSISVSMNTEKQEKLGLTATCANTKSTDSEIETWNLHCDLNGNGVIDKDESTKTVSVNTKANEFYCKGTCIIRSYFELFF